MIAGARDWLLSVISAAVLCSAAEALMPSGAVKQVGKLVCGLVLLCAVVSPAVSADLEGGQKWLEDYVSSLERRKGELEDQAGEARKGIIEEKYAAYIVDKARELGFSCSVRVTCREEEGIFLPDAVRVAGALGEQEKESLSRIVSQDLGVPVERQSYVNREGQP